MAIDPAEVRRIAALARLEIPEERIARTAAELSEVLEFVRTLDALDLAGLEPEGFAPRGEPLREDATNGRRLAATDALAMAPETEDGFFLVPPIVEHLEP